MIDEQFLREHTTGMQEYRELVDATRWSQREHHAGVDRSQGNRTCGIDHRPTAQFLDRLASVCGIDPPREHGPDTLRMIAGMHDGSVKIFVGVGGHFVLAAPDTSYAAAGMRRCALTAPSSRSATWPTARRLSSRAWPGPSRTARDQTVPRSPSPSRTR